jgi:hypothetical protein
LAESTLALMCAAGVLSMGLPAVAAEPNVVIEWRFDRDGDLQGCVPGGHLADVSAEGGALRGRAVDWDPILLGPVFEIRATPTQYVEIRMRANQAATAELFWTETLDGKYGGFSQEKSNRFEVSGAEDFVVYRIHPFWHAAGKIIRLRLDPPSDGRFEIEWIRIVDSGSNAATQTKRWQFKSDRLGWRPWQGVSRTEVRDGLLYVKGDGGTPILMSPLVDVSADENPIVAIRMAADRGSTGTVHCVSNKHFGRQSVSFPLRADGRMHTYNIDMTALEAWRDRIIMLGVQPTDEALADVTIEWIEIADDVRGPAELELRYFGRTAGVIRVGRPAEVTCVVKNLGGEIAREVSATLSVPEGVEVVGEAAKKIDLVSLYLPKTVSWRIQTFEPRTAQLAVRLEAPGVEPVSASTTIEFTLAPDVPQLSYVPEPKPVQSEYDIGVFYFPGWHDMSRWRPILDYPMRKPVLGWYDESNPQCADWQIKWAVEHGITFFMVDWYWSEGHRHLEHWLHDAYMKSRYRKYLKWAVMWANHNRPNTHSLEDWRRVTQYWIDHYFGMEEYYRIDDRPAVFVWAPHNIRRDVGGSEQAKKLYAMSQEMARDAGHKGIYFVAMSSHDSEARCRELKAEGYEAFTSYHGFQLAAQRAGSRHFGFDQVVATGPEVWRQADGRASGLLYMPIVDTGWSSEPWHRSKARVIHGRTPELFGDLCRLARDYAQETGKRIITIGPCNEWGEGSYIEPYAQYGFADLDELRAAFCRPGRYPPNLVPGDVGLGPYDLAPIDPKTAWQFNTNDDREGWSPNGQVRVTVRDGALAGKSTGSDPIFQGPPVQIEAAELRRLVVRMSATAQDRAQLFWSTTLSPMSEATSAGFDVRGDGSIHDYRVDLGKYRGWRGVVVSLRFDPVTRPGVEFSIDEIRLE